MKSRHYLKNDLLSERQRLSREELAELLDRQMKARAEAVAANLKAAEPINAHLGHLGLRAKLGALDYKREPYDEAIPLLAAELGKNHPDDILSAISQALAIPASRNYRDLFVRLFRCSLELRSDIRLNLAVAIARTTDKASLPQLIELLKDKTLGPDRIGLLLYLKARRRNPEISRLLDELKNDPELCVEIGSW